MQLITNGYIDYEAVGEDRLLLATTNNVTTPYGLVMGAGSALAMKEEWPTIPLQFAPYVTQEYGIIIEEVEGGFLGAFQTKYHWKRKSVYYLIEYSTEKLLEYVDYFDEIHLPFPGIANGGLDEYKVLDIIHVLPDNVIVYY